MFGAIEKCLESVFFLVTSQDQHMVAKEGPAVWLLSTFPAEFMVPVSRWPCLI